MNKEAEQLLCAEQAADLCALTIAKDSNVNTLDAMEVETNFALVLTALKLAEDITTDGSAILASAEAAGYVEC